ncbi:hypothetical protein BC829DRAFT_386667, partial [Chytridium lagenaria]
MTPPSASSEFRIRLPESFTSCRAYASALAGFIHRYGYLWQHHAVDFFTRNYWETVFPEEWRILKELSFMELLELGSGGEPKVVTKLL